MNTLKTVLKSKRFWAATIVTAVAVGIISIQRSSPKVEVLVEDETED
jgi:hypothetical protein